MRFQVLSAKHEEGTGSGAKRYKKGDIIETDVELDKKFVNKFRRIEEPVPTTETEIEAQIAKLQEALAAKRATKPQAVSAPAAEPAKPAEAPQPAQASAKEQPSSQPAEGPLGTDVTDQFPKAEKGKLKVFEKDGNFSVTEADAQDKAVNEEALASRPAVNKFLKSYLE